MLFLHALLFFVLGTSATIIPLRPRAGQSSQQTHAAGPGMEKVDEILRPSPHVMVTSSYYGLWHPRDEINGKQVPFVAAVGYGAYPPVASIDVRSVNHANLYDGVTPFVRVKDDKEYKEILGKDVQAPEWPKLSSRAYQGTIWIRMDEHGGCTVASQMMDATEHHGTALEELPQ